MKVAFLQQLGERAWPQIDGRPTLLVPVGSTEQHGPHLPLDTDARVAAAVALRAAAVAELMVAPTVAYGASGEHEGFAGTVSIGHEALRLLVVELGRSAARWAGRLVFVNGHGGNIVPAQQALFELKQEHRTRRDLLLLSLTYWDAAGSPVGTIPGLVQKQMGHACEWETSMVLRLNPQLVVGDVKKVPEVPHGKAFGPGYRAWVMPDRSESATPSRARASMSS